MDTWEDVKDIELGQEIRIATKADGFVHGVIFAKDEAKETLTLVNAGGQKVLVTFEEPAE